MSKKNFLNSTNANTMFTYPHQKSSNTHHSNALYIFVYITVIFPQLFRFSVLFCMTVERESMNICSHEWLCMYIHILFKVKQYKTRISRQYWHNVDKKGRRNERVYMEMRFCAASSSFFLISKKKQNNIEVSEIQINIKNVIA